MNETWRCFVGVPIGEELRSELASFVERLRKPPMAAALRWSEPTGWHVTLAFLGSVPPSSIAALKKALRPVAASCKPFSVTSSGLGAFPSPRDMRVLWYGVHDASGELGALAAAVSACAGLPPQGAFRAHLTLARSKEAGRGTVAMGTVAAEAGEPPRGVIGVDRIELYRSHLGNGPAQYEVLASLPLAKPG
jgi:2''-5'' RNA ligase